MRKQSKVLNCSNGKAKKARCFSRTKKKAFMSLVHGNVSQGKWSAKSTNKGLETSLAKETILLDMASMI